MSELDRFLDFDRKIEQTLSAGRGQHVVLNILKALSELPSTAWKGLESGTYKHTI